jgi:outer membrane immunogenic protein
MRALLLASACVAALTGAAAAAPVYDWTGFYVGITGGATKGTWTLSQYDGRTVGGGFSGDENSRSSGLAGVFGAEAGYNMPYSDMFVLGVEGDVNFTNAQADPWGFSFDGCGCATTNTKFYGAIRGRAGIAVDKFLIFATAGVAMGNTFYEYRDGPSDSESHIGIGPAYGIGVEAAVSDSMSIKAEYLHTDFGSPLFFSGVGGFESTVHGSADRVRVGFNFHVK